MLGIARQNAYVAMRAGRLTVQRTARGDWQVRHDGDMTTPDNDAQTAATDAATQYLFDVAKQYEHYLGITQPALLQPMENTWEYVRERAAQTPPLGFVMRTEQS